MPGMLAFSLILLLKPGPHGLVLGPLCTRQTSLATQELPAPADPPQLGFCPSVGCGETLFS